MICLGLSQDRYESGVCLSDGERVLFAANEERYSRRKNQGGFPQRALEAAFASTGMRPADVDRICCAGIMTPPLPLRAFPRLHHWLFDADRTGTTPWRDRLVELAALHTPLAHTSDRSTMRRILRPLLGPAVRRSLPSGCRAVPIAFAEHHEAHAWAAWTLSGFPEALALTADSMGDGSSATVGLCREGRIEQRWSAPSRHSLGRFYESVTEALGFLPSRHEGKVTGLAAHGDPGAIDVPSPFSFVDDRLVYAGPDGSAGVAWVRDTLLARHRREDVCAWAQEILEANVIAVARRWLRETGQRRLVVAGGVFANVKLNQRLHALPEVDALFVCPNMGDGGLALGAVAAEGGLAPHAVRDVFWGDEFAEPDLRAALAASGVAAEETKDIDGRIADAVADGALVGVFRGRMEWGPRALGNRSILASAADAAVSERLNRALERSDFMPFAPAILAEAADIYLRNVGPARAASRFMTCCFDATDRLRREHPAVVHVDGTVRAQLVDAETNPALHRVLKAVERRTGSGVVLNTSFNRHEEPIVRTPAEALATFRAAGLDGLALGRYWVDRG